MTKLPQVKGAEEAKDRDRYDPLTIIEDIVLDKEGITANVYGEGKKGWVYLEHP